MVAQKAISFSNVLIWYEGEEFWKKKSRTEPHVSVFVDDAIYVAVGSYSLPSFPC